MIYEESIKLLKLQGVEFETGLTVEEIAKIKRIFRLCGLYILESPGRTKKGNKLEKIKE